MCLKTKENQTLARMAGCQKSDQKNSFDSLVINHLENIYKNDKKYINKCAKVS